MTVRLLHLKKGAQLPATSVYTDADGKEQTADYTAVIQEMQFNRIVCFEKNWTGQVQKRRWKHI